MESNSDFLSFLSQNDPLGLLKAQPTKKNRQTKSTLLTNFEEIVNFFEDNGREPAKNSHNIKEFQLFCRLNSIRQNPTLVKELKPFDMYGLLEGVSISNISLYDILNNDPLNLLDGDIDTSIFDLNHVKKTDRIAPEYISRRKFCQDFDQYKPLFEAIHKDLEDGTRKLALYHSSELLPNRFYVLGGIVLFLKSVSGDTTKYNYNSGERMRYDGRTECVFDNGTTSDMLYRSLDKALQKDGYAITEPEVRTSSLAAEDISEADVSRGYIYVLRSHHSQLKNVPDVYKIGCTTSTVSDRIKNATKEPTYLYAPVDVVETYRCYNMNVHDLENRLHTFFDDVRLNINIPDEKGVVISPREWFCVRLEVIKEAIDKITNGTIGNFIYDPSARKIIAKTISSNSSDTIYEKIISEINKLGASMEKKPSLYKDKNEEGLRDMFLTILESRFDNISATGETFNHKGKTDILLKHANSDSNIFIGECKIWHGKQHFLAAINQLFDRYLTWRDTNTALIIFVPGSDFSKVVSTVQNSVSEHPYYSRHIGNRGAASFSYIFRLPQDSTSCINLEIILFHLDQLSD